MAPMKPSRYTPCPCRNGWGFSFFRFFFLPFFPFLLFTCSSSPQLPPDQDMDDEKPSSRGEDQDKRTKEPDAAAINKLVKQLGSSDFQEREAATRALEAIGLPALEALRKAAKDDD